MHHLSIDYLIIGAFFLITLIIGLRAGRGIKDIREYAIANRMYGTGVLTITFLATYLDGHNTIGTQSSMLSYGLIAGLTVIGSAIMLVYSGAFIVPKMLRFQKSITLGDLMKELYDRMGAQLLG